MKKLSVMEFENEEQKEKFSNFLTKESSIWEGKEIKRTRQYYRKLKNEFLNLASEYNNSVIELITMEIATHLKIGKDYDFYELYLFYDFIGGTTELDVEVLSFREQVGPPKEDEEIREELLTLLEDLNVSCYGLDKFEFSNQGGIHRKTIEGSNFSIETRPTGAYLVLERGFKLEDEVRGVITEKFSGDEDYNVTVGSTSPRMSLKGMENTFKMPEMIFTLSRDNALSDIDKGFFESLVIRIEENFENISFFHKTDVDFEKEKEIIYKKVCEDLKKILLMKRFS